MLRVRTHEEVEYATHFAAILNIFTILMQGKMVRELNIIKSTFIYIYFDIVTSEFYLTKHTTFEHNRTFSLLNEKSTEKRKPHLQRK